ncbi:hypothetical protein KFL_000260140 [Klebsormidium nitens]|uniref:Uncharacterized protein n=1 Tax=Klebsormidium nitens TaxID=105231 RepID=A0A1Y1HTN1_KLENI|nr:hypothetical protein KFL_000260140 [Klebsormidium nitens]|eukprot:GAQ79198.1 hypothetical protein KFL_000260140 [Klebsormidium nitens]
MRAVVLPNGLIVHSVSEADVAFLYEEIWEQCSYLDHGISIGPGDTVLDVGANIGLFTIQAARKCIGGRVLAFEPIPSIFSALQKNISLNVEGPPCARVELINAGLSDGLLHQAEFTFYEQAAGWSTMCEDEEELRTSMDIFLATALSTGEGLGDSPLASTGRWLRQRAPPSLSSLLTRLYVRWMLSRATKATCPLFTLSQIIEEYDIDARHRWPPHESGRDPERSRPPEYCAATEQFSQGQHTIQFLCQEDTLITVDIPPCCSSDLIPWVAFTRETAGPQPGLPNELLQLLTLFDSILYSVDCSFPQWKAVVEFQVVVYVVGPVMVRTRLVRPIRSMLVGCVLAVTYE